MIVLEVSITETWGHDCDERESWRRDGVTS